MSSEQSNLTSSDSPLKSAIRANSSYKIREFEWFEVETKIRLFVQKLLDPTLKQIYEDRRVVDKVQWSLKMNNDSVEMLRDVVMNQGAGIPIFEEFQKRIFETELKVEQERRKSTQEASRLESMLEKNTYENRQLQEQFRQIELVKVQLIEDFNEMKKLSLQYKDRIADALQNLSTELVTNYGWARKQMQQFEAKFVQTDLALADRLNSINSADRKIQDLKALSTDFTQKHQAHITKLDHADLQILQLFDSVAMTKKMTTQMQILQNELQTLDNYLSSYQPLYIQGQISESLFHCLPNIQVSKLAIYESKRFEEIHKNILNDDGQGKVLQRIQEYSLFMEGITKRNSKLMQTQRSKKQIVESDDSAADSDKEDSVDSEDEVSQESAKKIKYAKKGAGGQMSGSEAQHYEKMINQVRAQITDETKEFKTRIELTVKDVYSQIRELDEQMLMQAAHNQEDAESAQYQTLSEVQSLKDHLDDMKSQFTLVELSSQSATSRFKQLEVVMQSVLHYLVLVTHLLIQDEIDCQGIALMGVKDSNIDDTQLLPSINRKPVNKVLQVKSDCLSCSSHPLTTLTSFKLACLAYNPSDVTVDNKVYKRDQLLELCTKVLWAARKEMDEINGKDQQNRFISKLSSQKRAASVSVDAKTPLMTNINIQYNMLPPQNISISPAVTPTSNLTNKIQNYSKVIHLNVPLQQPRQAKRQQMAHRTQKKLFNLHQNLSSVLDGSAIM